MGICQEFCPVSHLRIKSWKAHSWLWGPDHPLPGPCSARDVHSCTGQVGSGSQKERKPWTKQCGDTLPLPLLPPPCFGQQAEPRGQKRPRVSPWQLTLIQGTMLPWNGSYLDKDHQPACWEQCPSLSSVLVALGPVWDLTIPYFFTLRLFVMRLAYLVLFCGGILQESTWFCDYLFP